VSSGIVLSTVRYEAEGEDLFGSWSDIILALVSAVEVAHKLDGELSEAHSGFDSDGFYERYHRYPSEQSFRNALDHFDFEAA